MKTKFLIYEANDRIETPLMANNNFYIDITTFDERFIFESFNGTRCIAPVNLSYL